MIIRIDRVIPNMSSKSLQYVELFYQGQAQRIATALFDSLPQGTRHRLIMELMAIDLNLYCGKTKVHVAPVMEVLDALRDCFIQACWIQDFYDHQHISAWENAQRILIEYGMIDPEHCQYET